MGAVLQCGLRACSNTARGQELQIVIGGPQILIGELRLLLLRRGKTARLLFFDDHPAKESHADQHHHPGRV